MCAVFVFFFFFQAEDGIRDSSVTGVQTCALPILMRHLSSASAQLWPFCVFCYTLKLMINASSALASLEARPNIKGKACIQSHWPYASAAVCLTWYAEEFAKQFMGIVQAHYPGCYLGSTIELGNNVLVFT